MIDLVVKISKLSKKERKLLQTKNKDILKTRSNPIFKITLKSPFYKGPQSNEYACQNYL
jgi:hypothetical protein